MKKENHFVVFDLDDQRCALYLSVVERVSRVAEYTILPKAPAIVLGVINVGGRIIPVIDIRKRFGLPPREMSLTDYFIVAQTSKRTFALVVDEVEGVARQDEDITPAREILASIEYIEGVITLEDGLILIHDLDKFLSLEEENILDGALERTKMQT